MPSVPNTFTAGTVIDPDEVNANFAVLEDCLDVSGGEVSGNILPDTTNSRNLGSASQAFANIFAYLVKLLDTDASHTLALAAGSNLSGNRTLTLTTGDASRVLTIGADSSISGTAYVAGGTDVALADGGTGASLSDPGADRIMFWDDSAGAVTWLTAGTNITITGTTISATGGVTVSGTDNRVVRMNSTDGIQDSGISIDDSDNVAGIVDLDFDSIGVFTQASKSTSTIYQAATDGFVNVVIDALSVAGQGDVEVRTDSNTTPTTVKGRQSVNGEYGNVMVPVVKGNYYRVVVNTGSGTVSATVTWTAVGTVG